MSAPKNATAAAPPAAAADGAGRVRLAGWGRVPVVEAREVLGEDLAAITRDVPLSRGLGRSYGDSSLPAPGDARVAGTVLADRILAWDPATCVLRAEAGFSLHDIVRLFLPRGYFTPVTPGTQFVTLGGMVASDVHGKNHHSDGTFGQHVTALRLRVADGRVVDCSPTRERDLFRATIGGMGLTGHILEVEVRLKKLPSPWIAYESVRVPDIDAYIAALAEAAHEWPQTVGWIDCSTRGKQLGRGVLVKGRWAEPAEAPAEPPKPRRTLSVPFELPIGLVNGLTTRIFNELVYRKHYQPVKRGIIHPEAYFYPLDRVRHWNRLYGKRGMTQYQCVLPTSAGPGAARRFLELVVARGGASPICVIKDCGPEGIGLLSFPRPGISIALDLPVPNVAKMQSLVDAMNELVLKEGGRIYLAKDAFTRAEHYRAMEPRLAEWETIRRKWDPEGRLRSRQSARVLGDVGAEQVVPPPPAPTASSSDSSDAPPPPPLYPPESVPPPPVTKPTVVPPPFVRPV